MATSWLVNNTVSHIPNGIEGMNLLLFLRIICLRENAVFSALTEECRCATPNENPSFLLTMSTFKAVLSMTKHGQAVAKVRRWEGKKGFV